MPVTTSFFRSGLLNAALLAGLLAILMPAASAQTGKDGGDVLAAQFAQGVEAYDAGKYARAFELWLPLAQNGDLAAQRNVAHLLRLGRGVPQDLPRARKFYEQSAEFGFVTAQTNLAVMLLNGEGGDQEPEEAAIWFDRAARGGHPIAQFNLARLYEQGLGLEADTARALGWYALAARSGYQPALNRLADLVPTLPGPSTNDGNTDETFEQAMSPELPGDAVAPDPVVEGPGDAVEEQGSLTAAQESPAPAAEAPATQLAVEAEAAEIQPAGAAKLPVDAVGKARSAYEARQFTEARHGFEALAYRGNVEAQYWLARMRNRGEGEPRDPVAALAWWSIAAEAGHEGAKAAERDLEKELDTRRRNEAKREAAQFKALIGQLSQSAPTSD